MASSNAVWGIDIGHCALKALRCRLGDDGKTLEAEAFDYIEYPKLLTQPDAEPEQLVKEALQQFLANNNLKGAKVGISVSGQSGLARFIKLPPVEAKKVPDIVKYEAKQQIPFPLEDVIWDYQRLGGGTTDDGAVLETEVGLFAMKRDQVFKALRPFRDAGIELDIVQLTPVAIFNAVTYGVLQNVPDDAEFDPDNPPESVAVISMGTDTTDLVITNGFKIWQRSIPIGGSHFTKQLMKEMKLTFAKAEHLKRNARDSKDPKAVFQAMRPVFNDMVQELQRSIGFFRSIDRQAKITAGVLLGNTVRLPGLQPYIEKNLDLPIKKVSSYENLTGSAVVSTPKYKDNILSFAVAYGLCLQGVSKSRLSTNLIPRELITARMIKRKKPWALAALTLLMLGFFFNYLFHWNRWRESNPEQYAGFVSKLDQVVQQSSKHTSEDKELTERFAALKTHGKAVVGGADSRFLVLELFKAINQALPFDETRDPNEVSTVVFHKRPELHIESIDSQYFPDLSEYVDENVTARYQRFCEFCKAYEMGQHAPAAAPKSDSDANADAEADADADGDGADAAAPVEGGEISVPAVSGPGWVIQIRGFHFYSDARNEKQQYLYNTVLKTLDQGSVMLPAGPGQPPEEVTMRELGIFLPILADEGRPAAIAVPDPDAETKSSGRGSEGIYGGGMNSPTITKQAFEFTIQFVWKETRASERLENKKNKDQEGDGQDPQDGETIAQN